MLGWQNDKKNNDREHGVEKYEELHVKVVQTRLSEVGRGWVVQGEARQRG